VLDLKIDQLGFHSAIDAAALAFPSLLAHGCLRIPKCFLARGAH